MINVTKTDLPSLTEYTKYLKRIWQSGQITNNGSLVIKLENKLKKYLGVKHLFFLNNGTTALQIAIKALGIKGEIITTPFSYVATTSSIVWENCKPVFVDIEPASLCIDVKKIESVITKKTQAILSVHVFGNSCNIESIDKLAKKYNLKVIYDAAHTFGINYKGKSILNFGDVSTLSFHATKVFHTVEGGAIVTNNDHIAHKISYMRNFGHKGYEEFWGLGINGKNSELHAAMGLCLLKNADKLILKRKKASETYDRFFEKSLLVKQKLSPYISYNYSYYPVIFKSEAELLSVKKKLNKSGIYPRRYFYPSLTTLAYVNKFKCPVSDEISKKILCLPLYSTLSKRDVMKIAGIINKVLRKE